MSSTSTLCHQPASHGSKSTFVYPIVPFLETVKHEHLIHLWTLRMDGSCLNHLRNEGCFLLHQLLYGIKALENLTLSENGSDLLASNCFKFSSPARLRGFLRSLTTHRRDTDRKSFGTVIAIYGLRSLRMLGRPEILRCHTNVSRNGRPKSQLCSVGDQCCVFSPFGHDLTLHTLVEGSLLNCG